MTASKKSKPGMIQKIYKVADIDTLMDNLNSIKDLNELKIPVKEQEKIFIEKTKHHRATFYRYRKKLGIRAYSKSFKYNGKDLGICYFCLKKAVITHHINQNKQDNKKENLLPLCKGCHTKIHKVLIAKND
jgi:hypothetical protein